MLAKTDIDPGFTVARETLKRPKTNSLCVWRTNWSTYRWCESPGRDSHMKWTGVLLGKFELNSSKETNLQWKSPGKLFLKKRSNLVCSSLGIRGFPCHVVLGHLSLIFLLSFYLQNHPRGRWTVCLMIPINELSSNIFFNIKNFLNMFPATWLVILTTYAIVNAHSKEHFLISLHGVSSAFSGENTL